MLWESGKVYVRGVTGLWWKWRDLSSTLVSFVLWFTLGKGFSLWRSRQRNPCCSRVDALGYLCSFLLGVAREFTEYCLSGLDTSMRHGQINVS